MAKELPYFKFEPSEWENGLIQMCSRESKGLFIDIISIYWQRLGDLPYRYVLQKLCNGNADALKELTDENIIKIDGGNIVIHFLDAQLKEFNLKSKQASEAAKARWEKHNENGTLDADAMQTHSEGNAIREEKSKEDKKKGKDIYKKFAHLKITNTEFDKLKVDYSERQINDILESVENYSKNKNYKSLYLTAKKWLEKKYPKQQEPFKVIGTTNQPIMVYKDAYSNEKVEAQWKQ